VSTHRSTGEVRRLNAIADTWGRVFQQVNLAEDATRDFLRAGSAVGSRPLADAIGGEGPSLAWLFSNGTAQDRKDARLIQETFGTYAEVLHQMLELDGTGDREAVVLQGDVAERAAAALRLQISADIERTRIATTDYLHQVDQLNGQVGLAALITFGFALLVLGFSSAILLGYQRRIERHAAASHHLATHDTLTGLPNRALLQDRAESAIEAVRDNGGHVGLLLIDLNRFKEINDTLGHHCGDQLLQQVATRLTGAARADDTVARLGGDEFAVLLPGLAPHATEAAAWRVHRALRQAVQLQPGGTAADVTFEPDGSVGVAVFATGGGSFEQLLKHADIAMYHAKRARLGVAVYDATRDDHQPNGLALAS